MQSALERIDLLLKDLKNMTLLELGCGVGRATSHLAPHFKEVVALDISPGNLSHAMHYFDQIGRTNVSFNLLKQIEEIEQFKNFDFFYSCIAAQYSSHAVVFIRSNFL